MLNRLGFIIALAWFTTLSIAAFAAPIAAAEKGRTLADYNIQKESTAPRPRIRIAPR